MTVTAADLDTKYAVWFIGMRNTGQAKKEILQLFSSEPDKTHTWSEQDICEQSRRIILKATPHNSDCANLPSDFSSNKPILKEFFDSRQ
mgnify:CR=1 FL=1